MEQNNNPSYADRCVKGVALATSVELKSDQSNAVARRFGQRLKTWRMLRKLPLKHIAEDLGASIQVVSDWERGVRFPCEKHLAQLEEYTGVPLCGFLHRADKECRCFQEGCHGCPCE